MTPLATFLNCAMERARTDEEIDDIVRALKIIDVISKAQGLPEFTDAKAAKLFEDLCAIQTRLAIAEASR